MKADYTTQVDAAIKELLTSMRVLGNLIKGRLTSEAPKPSDWLAEEADELQMSLYTGEDGTHESADLLGVLCLMTLDDGWMHRFWRRLENNAFRTNRHEGASQE